MSQTIARFSDPTNLTVQYKNTTDFVNAVTQAVSAEQLGDAVKPYTFKEWRQRNIYLSPNNEYNQYLKYVNDWYEIHSTQVVITNKIKEDYVNLLKELDIRFNISESTEKGWTDAIDFDNENDIDEAIPIFSRKLKEICLYLIDKRQSLKKSKLKYNMAGSVDGIEHLFYEYLLKAFTKRNFILNVPDSTAWNTFPELSTVNNNFGLTVEELYDDNSYFDHNPQLPITTYFNITSEENVSFYDNTLNVSQSAFDWLFSTGNNPLCADNPLLWTISDTLCAYGVSSEDLIPISAFDIESGILIDRLMINLSKKYLGEVQYCLSGGYFSLWTKEFTYPFIQGNNWFYWPSGEVEFEGTDYLTVDPIALSATNLVNNGAYGSDSYKTSDRIFLITNDGVSGSWLKRDTSLTDTATMSCYLKKNDYTRFKFPFCGIGLSGDGLQWTGPQLNNIYENTHYLEDSLLLSLKNAYYNYTDPVSSVQPVFIQDINLKNCGAHAATGYDMADKMVIRNTPNIDFIHDSTPNSVYNEILDEFWLYRFDKTDIPIKGGQNYIYWPVGRYDKDNTISFNTPSGFCSPINLSSINVQYGRSGYGLYDSDIVYKLDGPNGNSVECAFLSGIPLNGYNGTTYTANTSGIIQNSLAILCLPGETSTFIWTDSNKAISHATITIKNYQHQVDCPYKDLENTGKLVDLYENRPVQANPAINYSEWKKCTCGAVLYSPLGHMGNTYDDYDQMADIIYLDTGFYTNSGINILDLAAWRGEDNETYLTSDDFIWFKCEYNDTYGSKVGHFPGQWVQGNGQTSSFQFKKGKQYKYLRSKLRRDSVDINNWPVAGLVIKQPYTTYTAKWNKAILKTDGTWQETASTSDMILYPGDYILYDHMSNLWYCASTNNTLGYVQPTYENYNGNPYSYWMNYTHALTGSTVELHWPISGYYNGPTYGISEILSVVWDIKDENNVTIFNGTGSPDLRKYNFVVPIAYIGSYSISAQANLVGSGSYEFTNIEDLQTFATPVSYLSGEVTYDTIYTPTVNFMLNQQLSGWNYESTPPSANYYSKGAMPIWVNASNINDITTKYKGISRWGGGLKIVDGYSIMAQPPIADYFINNDQFIEYMHIGSSDITWTETLTINVSTDKYTWCDLIVDEHKLSPLSGQLNYISEEMVVSGSEIPSNLYLQAFYHSICTNDDKRLLINYWAINPFTWNQTLTDTSYGIPPTGGVWNNSTSGVLIYPDATYANMSNKHYPTIASVPSMDKIYNVKDTGYYFDADHLGVTTFFSKNNTIEIDPLKSQPSNIQDNIKARGLSAVFQDIHKYSDVIGTSKENQFTLTKVTDTDPSWMKYDITSFANAGNVKGENIYQKFIPYQTTYETRQHQNIGIRQQDDLLDPWIGTQDNEWADNENYPLDFRKIQPISKWYEDHLGLPSNKILWQWKSDIYNNQFGLYKESLSSIYLKKEAYGELWIRDVNNRILPAYKGDETNKGLLEDFYNHFLTYQGENSTYPYLFDQLTGNQIKDIDLWYDILMIYTPDYLVFGKIEMDDNNELYLLETSQHIIKLNDSLFAGQWYNSDENKVYLATIQTSAISSVSGVGFSYPDIGSNQSYFMDICAGSYINNITYPYNLNISFSGNGFGVTTTAWYYNFGDGYTSDMVVSAFPTVVSSGSASLFIDISAASYPITVSLSADSLSEPCTAYSWDFDDGTIVLPNLFNKRVTHTYTGYSSAIESLNITLTGYVSSGGSTNYLISSIPLTIYPLISSNFNYDLSSISHLYTGYTDVPITLTATICALDVTLSELITSFPITIYPLITSIDSFNIVSQIYQLDLNYNKLSKITKDSDENTIKYDTSVCFMSSIRDPIFSFNTTTNLFNIIFVGNIYNPNICVGYGSIYYNFDGTYDEFNLVRTKTI